MLPSSLSEEEKGGIERPTNTLSKSGNDAARFMVILVTDDPVEHLYHAGATVALTQVATVASLPALVQGQLREVQESVTKQEQQRF